MQFPKKPNPATRIAEEVARRNGQTGESKKLPRDPATVKPPNTPAKGKYHHAHHRCGQPGCANRAARTAKKALAVAFAAYLHRARHQGRLGFAAWAALQGGKPGGRP